ncbi:hypothetical protein [Leadbetterella sp. DM7]|uniref:hypothetical protein n=1 Tax=Leadbetterella sp. DM7 TaxID=3235085 RepID=UPI00349EC0EB
MKSETEKLKERYSKLTNRDLLGILNSWPDYTEAAVSLAKDELEFRALTNEEIIIFNGLKERIVKNTSPLPKYPGLETFEKLKHYVFPFPGYKGLNPLKQEQAKYYSRSGLKIYALILSVLFVRIKNLEEWMIYLGGVLFILTFVVIQFGEDITIE